MKKLLLLLSLLIPTTLFATGPTVDYYDLQHFKIAPATNTNRNDWYMRGSFHIVKSTWIVDVADCPIIISFQDDGTIVGSISTATFATTATTATWALDSDKLDGLDSSYFASLGLLTNEISSLTTTYLGLTAKAADSELLDGFDASYFAIKADVASSTNSLTARVVSLESSTQTIAGQITALWTSTSTLEGRIDANEILIANLESSTSTLEGYIFALWTSTQTLEAATALNTTHRSSDGSDHTFIDQDVTITGSPTFVDVTAKWKTIDIDTTTLVINDLLRWDGTNLVRIASGTSVGTFLKQDFTWGTPAGAGDMLQSVYDIGANSIVDNSEALNGFAYAHFVNTTTAQNIGGSKTFDADMYLTLLKKLYLDSGSTTYITGSAADIISFFVGDTERFKINGPFLDCLTSELVLQPTKKLWFDGASDTYIWESASNQIALVNGGTTGLFVQSNAIVMPALSKLYLDAGGDTYIVEAAADSLRVYVGGNAQYQFNETNFLAVGDGAEDLGLSTANDWGTIYYHTLSQHSDQNDKDNIVDVSSDSFSASLLPAPKIYQRIVSTSPLTLGATEYGLLAQDCPNELTSIDEDGKYSIMTDALRTYLVGVIKKQGVQIFELRRDFILRGTAMDVLIDRIEALEAQ